MGPELIYVAGVLVLALVQILAAAAARTQSTGLEWNMGPRDTPVPDLSPLAARLTRAQANLFETLPLFALAVIILHVTHRENFSTALGAALYFWGRVLYVPLYAAGVTFWRSLVWMTSLVGLVLVLAALFWASGG